MVCQAPADFQRQGRTLKEIPPGSILADALDAIAYHGHGPGAAAERSAYERNRAEAAKNGLAEKPFIETESGLAAHTLPQIRIQARTAIQKIVYAQSVGLPAFFWFRLYITGGDADYTNLKTMAEPRPAVLSYRSMVKTLRGLSFAKRLDLAGFDGEGYFFTQKQGDSRALALWANARSGGSRTFQLAGQSRAVSDCRLVDMFGNVTPLKGAESGLATVPIEQDPVFVAWRTADTAFTANVLPSPLEVETPPASVTRP
jgi:hypothetical protein